MRGSVTNHHFLQPVEICDSLPYVVSSPILLKLHDYLGRSREIDICNIYNWLEIFLQIRKKSCNIITVGENTPLVKLQGGNNASEAT